MMALTVSAEDRPILLGILRATTLPACLSPRARVTLALADGQSYVAIAAAHGVTGVYRPLEASRRRGGISALGELPRRGRPSRLDPEVERRILAKTQEPLAAPFTHWPTRRMAAVIQISHDTAQQV